ncbi:MAG TPA: hypothetical protein VNO70_14515 [Blastocatellia bacterium]|nr:hypothetical protein [Blastocatellia bacterium]
MRKATCVAIALAALALCLSRAALAQEKPGNQPDPVAKRTDIYCTGFIAELPPRAELQVIGGEKENFQSSFAEGHIVFLNKGREHGVVPGSVYQVIRPLGLMKHPFTRKKLGHFVREVGLLRVVEVQNVTATAEIMVSCDTVELGDLLRPYEEYVGPEARDNRPLPRYAESSGGTKGRIIMAPNEGEYLAANRVVYIDLGKRNGVNPGDYFTIYRKIGKSERIVTPPRDNIVQERSDGYHSDHYKGGDYSIEATRVPLKEVRRERPSLPRKVVGEMVVLKVENTTAVALITRTTAEVNIGDHIELQTP